MKRARPPPGRRARARRQGTPRVGRGRGRLLRRRALDARALDDAGAVALFLSAGGGGLAARARADAGARRGDCVCGRGVPPDGERTDAEGLWRKAIDVLVRETCGEDPAALVPYPAPTIGASSLLGNTCFVQPPCSASSPSPPFARVFEPRPRVGRPLNGNRNGTPPPPAPPTRSSPPRRPPPLPRPRPSLRFARYSRRCSPVVAASSTPAPSSLPSPSRPAPNKTARSFCGFSWRTSSARLGPPVPRAATTRWRPSSRITSEDRRDTPRRAGRADATPDASAAPVDFYEIELNVGPGWDAPSSEPSSLVRRFETFWRRNVSSGKIGAGRTALRAPPTTRPAPDDPSSRPSTSSSKGSSSSIRP